MRRVWDWYRARRWWTKILVAAPAVLLVVVLLYVAIRGVQYASSGGDARDYVPASANFSCGVRDLDGEWERIREGALWKSLDKGALKDKAFRAKVNEELKGSGLPTLDQLEDRRYLGEHPEFREENLLRLAGRDVAAGLRVGDDFGKAKFVVATKVRFTDYLLLPFAGFVLPKEKVGDRTALRIAQGKKTYYLVIDDAYVVASDDRGLLADGMRKKGKKPKLAKPFWMRADFTSSAALAKWRRKFRGFPAGLGLAFMNAETAKSMEAEFAVPGSSILADVRLDGAQVVEAALDPGLASYAPDDASLWEVQAAGMAQIYEWLKSLGVPDPKAKGFDKFLQEQAKSAVKELNAGGFETSFVTRVAPPMAIVLGTELDQLDPGSPVTNFTTFAIVMKSPDPKEAIEKLRIVLQQILKNMEGFGVEPRAGGTIIYFNRKSGIQGQNAYLRPVMAEVGETVILGNNLRFVQRVMDAAVGEIPRRVDEASFRQARKRMKDAGFEAPGTGADAGGGWLSPPAMRQALQGHIPNMAKDTVDTNTPTAQIRAQIVAEMRSEGKDPAQHSTELLARFKARQEELVAVERAKIESSLKSLDYLKWVAFGARAQNDRVALRFMIEVR